MLDDNQQRQVGVHCYWHENDFLCVTNRNNRQEMGKIWEKTPEDEKKFRAPRLIRLCALERRTSRQCLTTDLSRIGGSH